MQNKKIKICHVANTDKALRFLLLPQLKFLQDEGYDVSAVSSAGKFVVDIEKRGIKVEIIEMKRKISPFSDLVALIRLFLYFRKEKFQIVHVHNPKPGLLGQLAARMAGVPIVINTIHGLYFHEDSSAARKSFYTFIEKIAALCSDTIFSQSREDIKTLIDERITKPEKIKYLGNGVDVDRFNMERFFIEGINRKKKELSISEDFKVVGIVARLVKEKGYFDLFKAFDLVVEKLPKTTLLVVGPEEPEKKDAVKHKSAEDYNIEKNTIFLGERDDVDEIYSVMDVFVLPSYREGLPRSILEAMAMQRPIVATDIRGCREEIENGKNGILVPVRDPVKLAEAIISLLKNPASAKEMGKNSRAKVTERFDEKVVFDRIEREYNKLLEERGY